ncbi:hypothetical protein SLS60_008748 [Paraconiothyrium brasiliense]|uniref:C2H2-type domain-containing protein n=1 Tax=Paraconiothyrium brasiliense TaxID=300254 RepID=A0ABR3QYD1_9PLEO
MAPLKSHYKHKHSARAPPPSENISSDEESILTPDMPGHSRRDWHKQPASWKSAAVRCQFCGKQGVTFKDCCEPFLQSDAALQSDASKRPGAVHLKQGKFAKSLTSGQLNAARAAAVTKPSFFRPFPEFPKSESESEQADVDINNVEMGVKTRAPGFRNGIVDSSNNRDFTVAPTVVLSSVGLSKQVPKLSSDNAFSQTDHRVAQKDQDKSPSASHKAVPDRLPFEVALAERYREENMTQIRRQFGEMDIKFADEDSSNIVPSPTTNSTKAYKAAAVSDTFSSPEDWPGDLELCNDPFRRTVEKGFESNTNALPGSKFTDGAGPFSPHVLCPICDCMIVSEDIELHMKRKDHRKQLETRKIALGRQKTAWDDGDWATTGWGAPADPMQNSNQVGHASNSSNVASDHENISSSDNAAAVLQIMEETVRARGGRTHWGPSVPAKTEPIHHPTRKHTGPSFPPRTESSHKPTVAFASADSVQSKDDVSEEDFWPGFDSPSNASLDNELPQAPVRQDLVVTYWITVESGGQQMHVPIEPGQVVGSEKDIITSEMKNVWQWVQDKTLGDKVSLQDAFDLAQKMHGGATKTSGGDDEKRDTPTHFSNGEQTGGLAWGTEERSNNPITEVSSHAATKKEDCDSLGWSLGSLSKKKAGDVWGAGGDDWEWGVVKRLPVLGA